MSVQLDDDLEQQIQRLADSNRTTPDQIVREAISDYAMRLDARLSFQREADASWEAYQSNGLHLTGEELSAWLKMVGTDEEPEMPECHR